MQDVSVVYCVHMLARLSTVFHREPLHPTVLTQSVSGSNVLFAGQ